MRKLDFKSVAVGLLIGTLGVTTAFAAGGIQSAEYSNTGVILNGQPLTLNTPLIAVTKGGENTASMYMPVREIMEAAGYQVTWDGTENVVVLEAPQSSATPNQSSSTPPIQPSSHPLIAPVVDISSAGETLVATSGFFSAKEGQKLTLSIVSSVKGGTVDFFLFDPNGKEQKITIESKDMTQEIPLSEGKWAYNCFGKFESGSVDIKGSMTK